MRVSLPTAYWHDLVVSFDSLELPKKLRCVIIGGERAIPEKVSKWQRRVKETIDLYNTYGPTEGTIVVTRCRIPEQSTEAASATEIPIGTPVANTQIYVLDGRMRPVPPGIPGEVYVGGLALARGYIGRPGHTAEKFVPNPFGELPGARLYRTGDLARFLPDGNLQYRGRIDDQVKIRGFRIEPREVEHVLLEHPEIQDVVVVAREDGSEERRLVAYLVAHANSELDAAAVRAYLAPKLPSYMVPSAFVLLPKFPLNANAKVDVRALPAPDDTRGDFANAGEYVAPRGATEKTLAVLWAEVLKVDRVGIYDNFFDLGGHSLLAMRLTAHIKRALNIELPLRQLFDAPTIAGLVEVVTGLEQPSDMETGTILDGADSPPDEAVASELVGNG